jgi:WD40 repeat protein
MSLGQPAARPALALGGADGSVRLYDSSGRPGQTILAHDRPVAGLAFSADGRLLASCSFDRSAKIWNAALGTEETSIMAHERGVTCLALSPDSRTLATGGADNSVKLWSSLTGKPKTSIAAHSQPVRALAWSPDGRLLASTGADRLIQVWRADGTPAGAIVTQDDPLLLLAWTRGGTLVGASPDGYVKVWSAADLSLIARQRVHDRPLTAAAVTADGESIATAGVDGRLRLLSVRGRVLVETALAARNRPLVSLSWNGPGTLLVGLADDRTIHYFSRRDLSEIHAPITVAGNLTALAVSPD